MKCGNCDNVGGERKRSRLFFYFTVVIVICVVVSAVLCACLWDTKSGAEDGIGLVPTITFVLNNGEGEITREIADTVPEPSREGYYLYGWYADAEQTARVEFSTLADIINGINSEKFLNGEYKVYAKWEELKTMTGVRMKDSFFIYDGKSHKPEIEGLPENAEVEYLGEEEYIDAGEYDVIAVVRAYGYKELTLECKQTIQKAKADITNISFADITVEWDGEEKSIKIEGELPDGVSVRYENNNHKEAGVYEVTAIFDSGNNYESIPDMRATLTIRARAYRIRLVEEDGTYKEISVQAGGDIDIPRPKEKKGYIGRWSREDWDDIREDVTVYAVYELAVYRIEYESNGGTLADNSVAEYTVEESVKLTGAEREYYTFAGWYESANYDGDAVTRIEIGSTGNRKYYARWIEKEYEITYELKGGMNNAGNVNENGKYVYTVSSTDLILRSPTKPGYKFIMWKDESGECVTEIRAEVPQTIRLYAEWEAIRYSISYEFNGGINSDENPKSYTAEDEEIVLANPEKYGYRFMGWYENAEYSGERIERISPASNKDMTLYAWWEYEIFTVEGIGGRNIITGYNYAYGKEVTVPASIEGKEIFGIASGVLKSAESVELIGFEEINEDAFIGCNVLRELKLSETLKSMPTGLLADCTALESLTVPYATDKKLYSVIGEYSPLSTLFGRSEKAGCYAVGVRKVSVVKVEGKEEIKIGDVYEDYKCYVPSSLKKITVLGGEIAPYALYGMSGVREVRFEGEVKSIGVAAMMGCSNLERVVMSESITSVRVSAFGECGKLKEIYIHESTAESILAEVMERLKEQGTKLVRYGSMEEMNRQSIFIIWKL